MLFDNIISLFLLNINLFPIRIQLYNRHGKTDSYICYESGTGTMVIEENNVSITVKIKLQPGNEKAVILGIVVESDHMVPVKDQNFQEPQI